MTKEKRRNRPPLSGAHSPARVDQPLWLWGTHAVAAALINPRRGVHRTVATENAARRMALEGAELATVKAIDALLPPGAVHQGVAAWVDPLPTLSLEALMEAAPPRIAVLDQVADPHNVGAVFRSAAAFGFGAVILQTRHSPPLTGVVAKSAAGAVDLVRECRVVNIARTLDALGRGGWRVVGLAGEGGSDVGRAVAGADRLVIALGAEGAGLRPAVAKACDRLARIPIAPAIESLNVSNAAAIAFYAVRLAGQ